MEYNNNDFTIEEYLESRNDSSSPSRRTTQTPKKPKKKRRFWKFLLYFLITILLIALIIGITQYNRLKQISEIFDSTTFTSTSSQKNDAKGILVIGTDLTGTAENLDGYADSITYFGLNTTNKNSASLPIYRDARVPVTCNNDTLDNINRITKKYNISCFAESTSKMLELPVDYYVAITIDGVETVVDKIGGVTITPKETFSSDFGRDGQIHHFVSGKPQKMDGPTVVAYLRDRQHGNGENRANRQLTAIQAVKSACENDILKCYNDVLPSVSSMMRTNIPVDKITMLSAIGDKSYNSKAFPVIDGQNTQLADGWSQIINESDRKVKTDYIRTNIFN